MPVRSGELAIGCQQRCLERFGERDVYRIVRRERLAQAPDPRQQVGVRVPDEGQIGKVC
jgi:hypothetical protein